jgi:MYXO-CTERM domain-containing protein
VAGPLHAVSIDGLQPGEIVHVALANPLDFDVTIGDLRVAAQDVDAGGSSTGGGETDEAGDVREEVAPTGAQVGGCGCANAPASRRPAIAFAMIVLAAARRRRPR